MQHNLIDVIFKLIFLIDMFAFDGLLDLHCTGQIEDKSELVQAMAWS